MTVQPAIKPGIGHVDLWMSEAIVQPTLPIWAFLGATPNMLTSLGVVASWASLYTYDYDKPLATIVLIFLRAYFDYLDGIYARTYDMSTPLGDFYDHFNDVTFFLGFIYVTWQVFPKKHRALVVMLLMLSIVLTCCQMSCIEKECGDDQENRYTLELLNVAQLTCGEPVRGFLKYCDNLTVYTLLCAVVLMRHNLVKKGP
jgi:phosphatidylglycerophosphate synthase